MSKNELATVTPNSTPEVSFTEKVEQVDEALRTRATAQRNIKTKWAAVVKCLKKYDCHVPVRRRSADTVYNIQEAIVYEPLDPRLEDRKQVAFAAKFGYVLNQNLMTRPDFREEVDKQFPGFAAWSDNLSLLYTLHGQPRTVDEEATKAARADLQAKIDDYIKSIEEFDETVESVANVKEYIAVVKDVAEISAIAKGAQKETE